MIKHTDTDQTSRTRLGGGLSADVFLLWNDRVLKVFKPLYYGNADIEFRKTRMAEELGVPVPKLYGLTVTEEGAPAIEMERVRGMNMSKFLRRHPERYLLLIYKLALLSSRLHSFWYDGPWQDEIFAEQYMDAKFFFTSRIPGIARLQGLFPEEVEEMLRFVESIPESRCFLHGDLDPTNVMVSEDGKKLVAVDFKDSGFGSWIFDLRRMHRMYYEPKVGRSEWIKSVVKRLVFRFYLYTVLRTEKRSIRFADAMRVLGALCYINELIGIASEPAEAGSGMVRKYADRALKYIHSLPGEICPSDMG